MKILTVTFLVLVSAIAPTAQSTSVAPRFPGLGRYHVEVLDGAKQVMPIPVPTWLPTGFSMEDIKAKLGSMVPLEDKQFLMVYSRKLADGKVQRFAIEAGLDGIGGLPYDVTHTLSTPVGKIELMYEPPDLDDSSKKIKNFAITEWFKVGKTEFHYIGRHGDPEDKNRNLVMISLADTERILKSLRRY